MRILDVTSILFLISCVSSQKGNPYQREKVLPSRDSNTKPEDEVEVNSLSSHLLDLLPEFSSAIDGMASKPGSMQPMDMFSTFLPIIQKAIEAQAAGENQQLNEQDEVDMAMTITVIDLSVRSISQLMSPTHSEDIGSMINSLFSISKPIMEANAKREGRPMTKVEKTFIYYFENGYTFFIESMNDFTKEITPENMVKASSKVASYIMGVRAREEGRQMSYEEKETIKEAENQMITTIDIMRGFYGNPGIENMTNTFMRLMNFIMNSKARSELPRRWALTWQERLLINRTDTTLRGLGSLISNIHDSSATSDKLAGFGTTTMKIWEAQVEKEERKLEPEEIRFLQFTDKIINLPKSIYKAVVPF